jgi:hypothetical protein
MRITYLLVTTLAALMNGYAAVLSLTGAQSVKAVADRLHISQQLMRPFGILLASGSLGLLAGVPVPALGVAAAVGLILYFICAVTAHLRARDTAIGGASFFLVLAVAALVSNLAYRHAW